MKSFMRGRLHVVGILLICLLGGESFLQASSPVVIRPAASIRDMDQALAVYYISKGRTDYYSSSGEMGKFAFYCDENDFSFPEVEEELAMKAGDCMLVDFDD